MLLFTAENIIIPIDVYAIKRYQIMYIYKAQHPIDVYAIKR